MPRNGTRLLDMPSFFLARKVLIPVQIVVRPRAKAPARNFIEGCKMSREQQGFTLIELMIVVAIIAILAAIALPSYHDYTVRAQVGECPVLASGAKTAVAETFLNTGALPADNTAAGLSAAAAINGKFVGSVTVINGTIACQFSSVAPQRSNAAINGQTFILTPVPATGSVVWTCSSATILQKFLPTLCRNNSN